MRVKKLTMMLAAAGLAISPLASANAASQLSAARAMAPVTNASFLQDDVGDESEGGGSMAIIAGFLIVVLIAVVATAGGDDEGPDNTPTSP